tara:strand:- start:930 stop:1247 length:318 start_codon:yes stop_codon:yes gene_type:complete
MTLRLVSSGYKQKTESKLDSFYLDSVPYDGTFPVEITSRDRSVVSDFRLLRIETLSAALDGLYLDSVPYNGLQPTIIFPRPVAAVSTPRTVAAVGTNRTVTPIVS